MAARWLEGKSLAGRLRAETAQRAARFAAATGRPPLLVSLLVGDDEVLVVDFKTGRRVPPDSAAVSLHHKAQMAAYVAVLRGIFPDRVVRAALLYTSGPVLIPLSDADLEPHKPGYREQQDNLAPAG